MADYVSILKRTLDGLGSGATPALRERVYGRARDAVRRQLDGMVPPPAEDVKARQIEQLENAIREVEATYDDGSAPEPPEGAPAGTEASPEPRPVPEPAPTPPPAPEPVPAPEPPAPEPVAASDGPDESAPAMDEPDPAEDALPPVSDLPPSESYGPPSESYGSSSEGYGPVEADPSPAVPDIPTADSQPLAPDAERRLEAPEILDGDGPVGGDLGSETPSRHALIGPNGGAVLDPSRAVPLGPLPSDAEAGDRAGADPALGDAMGIGTGSDDADRPVDEAAYGEPDAYGDVPPVEGPPPATLASTADAMPHPTPLEPVALEPAPLGPDGEPRDGDPTIPSDASALALASGLGSPADARATPHGDGYPISDLPPELRSPYGPGPDDAAPDEVGPALPRASDMPDTLSADSRLDAAADGRADGSEPTVVVDRDPLAPSPGAPDAASTDPLVAQGSLEPPIADPADRAGPDAGPPNVPLSPPPGQRRGAGGILAIVALLLAILAGAYYLRDEVADVTGVEEFRTAFGLAPAVDGLLGRDVDAPDETVVADADPVDPVEPVDPAPAEGDAPATVIVPDRPTETVAPTPPAGETVTADAPIKFEDRLPVDDGPIDAAPRSDDVTTTTVPVIVTDGNGDPVTDGATEGGADDPSGTEVAAVDPAPTTPVAVPADGGRVFLIGEPVAGVSERAEGGVSWSVVEASPGSGLPPEPAIRGDVTLEDGSAVEVTVRRNADETLPASHLIEIVFALPDGGRTVSRLPLVGFKDALNVPARPLVAVPAKITDEFFVVGLNSLQSAVESNLALMREEGFMDVQLVDGDDRRATLTLEKGERGAEVFAEVLAAWDGAPLPG